MSGFQFPPWEFHGNQPLIVHPVMPSQVVDFIGGPCRIRTYDQRIKSPPELSSIGAGFGPVRGNECRAFWRQFASLQRVCSHEPKDHMKHLDLALATIALSIAVAAISYFSKDGAAAAFAETFQGPHPLCALWNTDIRHALRSTLEQGQHPSVRGFLTNIGAAPVWFEAAGAFVNANTRDILSDLERSR